MFNLIKNKTIKISRIFFNLTILFDWYDIGLVIRLYKNIKYSDYYISLDIQIFWLNLWFQLFKKRNK